MNSAPFGSSSNRFTISGLHPQLLTRGHIPHDTTHIPESVTFIKSKSEFLRKNFLFLY